jgi:hypothetical protein
MRFFDKMWLLFFMIILLLSTSTCSDQNALNGDQKIIKSLFYESKNLSSIVAITFEKENSVFIFGQRSMHWVNKRTKQLESVVKFAWPTSLLRPDIAFIKDDYMIVSRGPVSELGVMNSKGEKKWIFKNNSEILPNTMSFGDLNKDGLLEFYIATNKGVFQLDTEGHVFWKRGDESYDVEVVKYGKESFIASVCNNGLIECRDFKGILRKTIKTSILVYDIECVDWLGFSNILTYSGNRIFVLDLNGKIIFSHNLEKNIYMIRGVQIHFDELNRPYLAILAKFSSAMGKSMLCIFTPDKNLFYKELIDVSQGIAAIEDNFLENQALIVGDGIGRVYRYSLAQ